MPEWNFDISTAPRGHWEEDRLPGRGGSTRTVRRYSVPRVILASKCGKVIVSRWLPPDEDEKRPVGRWNGFMAGEEIVAWQPYPRHPLGDGNV